MESLVTRLERIVDKIYDHREYYCYNNDEKENLNKIASELKQILSDMQ